MTNTEAVFEHHVDAFGNQDLEESWSITPTTPSS